MQVWIELVWEIAAAVAVASIVDGLYKINAELAWNNASYLCSSSISKMPKVCWKSICGGWKPFCMYSNCIHFSSLEMAFHLRRGALFRSQSSCIWLCVCVSLYECVRIRVCLFLYRFGLNIGTDLCPYIHRTFISRCRFRCILIILVKHHQFIMHAIAQLALCVRVHDTRIMHAPSNNTITGIVSKIVIQILQHINICSILDGTVRFSSFSFVSFYMYDCVQFKLLSVFVWLFFSFHFISFHIILILFVCLSIPFDMKKE